MSEPFRPISANRLAARLQQSPGGRLLSAAVGTSIQKTRVFQALGQAFGPLLGKSAAKALPAVQTPSSPLPFSRKGLASVPTGGVGKLSQKLGLVAEKTRDFDLSGKSDLQPAISKVKALATTLSGLSESANKLRWSVEMGQAPTAQKSFVQYSPALPAAETAALPFQKALGFNPLQGERGARIAEQEPAVRQLEGFREAVKAGQAAVESPANKSLQEAFTQRLGAFLGGGNKDVMAMLFLVFKESIQEQNENKKYVLEKLESLNSVGEALSNQLKELREASEKLAAKEGTADSADLKSQIASVDAQRETVRNERQMAQTQFENANQKATQYVNMLSSVLKTMNEMKSGIIRNLS